MRGRWVLVVVACLSLAGCGGTEGPVGGPPSPSVTVTPAPLPTDTPPERTPTPGPGDPVTPSRLFAVSVEHAAALADTSFTVTEHRVVGSGGGAVFDASSTLRVAANGTYRYDSRRVADPVYPGPQGIDATSLYRAGDRTLFRAEDDGSVRYGAFEGDAPFGPSDDRTGREFLAELAVAFGNWTAVESDRVRLYRSDTLTDPALLPAERRLGTPRNASVRVRVRGRVVERVRLTYVGTLNGDPVRVTVVRHYDAVGETVVEPPAWLDEALAAVGTPTPETPTPEPAADRGVVVP